MTWASEIADAQAAIKDGGRGFSGTISTPGAATGDAHNPTRAADTEETAYLIEQAYRESEIDGERVIRGDRRFMVSTEGVTNAPAVGSGLTVGSDAYKIVNVSPFSPGGEVIYWTVQARG